MVITILHMNFFACFKSGYEIKPEALWHTQYMQQWLGGIQNVSEQYVVLLILNNKSAIRCKDCITTFSDEQLHAAENTKLVYYW